MTTPVYFSDEQAAEARRDIQRVSAYIIATRKQCPTQVVRSAERLRELAHHIADETGQS